jgi:hypothetical protein
MVGIGRCYVVSFDNASFTNANGDHDYFEITPADDKPCVIEAIYVYTTSEVGDTQEEQVRWSIVRGHTTSGSGGAAPTPQPIQSTDTAAGFTAETNNTTIASTAGTTIHVGSFNIRVGLEYVPPPEHRIIATQAHTTLVVRQLSTLADDATMSGSMYVREIG